MQTVKISSPSKLTLGSNKSNQFATERLGHSTFLNISTKLNGLGGSKTISSHNLFIP